MCGHASYGDMYTWLHRNKIWINDVKKILSSIVDRFYNCVASAPPLPNRKVSISGIHQKFNDGVCVDQFQLDKLCLFHAIVSYSCFSAVIPVKSAGLTGAVVGFGIL